MNKKIVITAAALLAVAIILGAFGAHGLKAIVSPEKVESFETGVKYQFYSAFGLLILGLNTAKFHFSLKVVNSLLLIGTFLFSFSVNNHQPQYPCMTKAMPRHQRYSMTQSRLQFSTTILDI